MRPGAIKLHIGELVLEGFEPRDRMTIGASLETELARLLATGDPDALTQTGGVSRLDGGAFELPAQASPEVAGTRLARAVYEGLTGQAGRRGE